MRKAIKRLRKFIEIESYCRKLTRFGEGEYFKMFKRAVSVCGKKRFTPREAYLLGLYGECENSDQPDKYVSRKSLTKLQKRVNPVLWEGLLKNKGMFYKYCRAVGIDVPELYALYFKGDIGWAYNENDVMSGKEQWCDFIEKQLPNEFVVKPARGAHGEGVEFFVRNDNGFVNSKGDGHDAEGVLRFISGDGYRDGFVIQKRLMNHGQIERLTDSEYLQTVRVVTFVNSDGTSRIVHGHLKLTGADNIVDNFGDGCCDNIQCMVELDSGRLKAAVRFRNDGSGIEVIERHEQTGVVFEGFELPLWGEICEIVKRASLEFLPVRAIGWDVGITPEKAVIVEGNIWWDPHNQHQTMDATAKILSEPHENSDNPSSRTNTSQGEKLSRYFAGTKSL